MHLMSTWGRSTACKSYYASLMHNLMIATAEGNSDLIPHPAKIDKSAASRHRTDSPTHLRPLSAGIIRHRLDSNNIRCRRHDRGYIYTGRGHYNGTHDVSIDVISKGGTTSSLMKVAPAFYIQITVSGFRNGGRGVYVMQADVLFIARDMWGGPSIRLLHSMYRSCVEVTNAREVHDILTGNTAIWIYSTDAGTWFALTFQFMCKIIVNKRIHVVHTQLTLFFAVHCIYS